MHVIIGVQQQQVEISVYIQEAEARNSDNIYVGGENRHPLGGLELCSAYELERKEETSEPS